MGDVTALVEPRLRRLYDYWRERWRGEAPPARADIDPAELKPLLPNLALVDVEEEPRRFRFRLVGTDIVQRYGEEITGRRLDEVGLGCELAAIAEQYDETVREQAPTYCRHELPRPGGKRVKYERLLLPLSSDGRRIDMLLGGYYPLGLDTPLTLHDGSAAREGGP